MIPSSAPTAVVFDLGGVLIDWDPRYLYRSVFEGDEAAVERFLAEVTTADWNAQQDAGRPWAEAIETLAREHPHYRTQIEAFWTRWPETLGDAIQPTVEILAELRRADVRVLALTNWSGETFPLARPRYPFLDWFDGIVVSGDVRMAKPDPRIFRHLIERHELDPSSSVFIDDSEANVRAAEAAGMIGIRFTDAAALRVRLVELGLLPPAEVLLITGVYGAGKSLLASNVGDELERRDLPFAALDLDWLSWFNPSAGAETERSMLLRNVAAVSSNYRSAGVRWLVLAGSVAEAAEVDDLRATIGLPVRVLRLDAPLAVIERRLLADGRPRDFEVAQEWAGEGRGGGFEDRTADSDRPVAELVRETLDWLGWG